ncbi:MAG: glucuronate isomerase [Clostridiales bacterium]|nr:glucuronate isomerase [Clostridiales bacterium]
MATFINNQFLLHSPTAENLYFSYAQNCPIVDYHCHIEAKDIAQDISFKNLTQLWLSGDHYKWRLMRSAGVNEDLITGDASDHDKFIAWAGVLEGAIGNPLYHWSHLELFRYFDISEPLTSANAEKVWEITCEKLASGEITARSLIKKSNVKLLCTTDDPIDDLRWHRVIADDALFETVVLPAFRPDRIVDIEKGGFVNYLQALSKVSGTDISNWYDLKLALRNRISFFEKNGCRLADHGMEKVLFAETSDDEANSILIQRITHPKQKLTQEEVAKFKTAIMIFFASEYKERNWTMQLHFGCRRDNNESAYRTLGINTGFDTISGYSDFVEPLANFMSILTLIDKLPRTILYSLNPNDNAMLDTLIGCFQDGSSAMKIQHGAAWWFNDNLHGMQEHLRSLAEQSYLPGFVGMLTDSRSFLSYTRHEYFRRILCNFIGDMVERGEFPKNMEILGRIVTDICYNNALSMFEDVK